MQGDPKENVIEWCNGEDTISVTLNQVRLITKVRKLAEKYPEKVQILAENKDGSIFAHLPLKSLKLSIITPTPSSIQGIEAWRNRKKQEEIDD